MNNCRHKKPRKEMKPDYENWLFDYTFSTSNTNDTDKDEENRAKIKAFNERLRDEMILDLANEVNELREALRVKDLRILELLGLYENE